MFTETVSLTSTDKTVTLVIKAGPGGVKSITLEAEGRVLQIQQQQLIDIAAPSLLAFAEKQQ